MDLRFRPLLRSDFPLLSEWLRADHVQRWWRESGDAASIEAEYGPAVDGQDPTEHLVVELDSQPIGMVQRYRLADNAEYQQSLQPTGTPARSAGLDYLIGDATLTGVGVGPKIVALAAADAWARYADIDAIVVVVQQANRPSWRALEKCGFGRVWAGVVESGDPSDQGPSFVYVLDRPSWGRCSRGSGRCSGNGE